MRPLVAVGIMAPKTRLKDILKKHAEGSRAKEDLPDTDYVPTFQSQLKKLRIFSA